MTPEAKMFHELWQSAERELAEAKQFIDAHPGTYAHWKSGLDNKFGLDASEPLERVHAQHQPARGVEGPSPVHASDCAVHNAPALPVGPCDCGADLAITQG